MVDTKPVQRFHVLYTFMSKTFLFFTEYQTPKIVQVKNKKIALLNRLIQLSILTYILGYVIIYNKGYQKFSGLQSNVISKLKGTAYGNVTKENANPNFNISHARYYNHLWDHLDVVQPPVEDNGFFVTTNVIITPNQQLGRCAESPNKHSFCNVVFNNCTQGHRTPAGAGEQTGRCVPSVQSPWLSVCEVIGWCPVEIDELPLRNQTALLAETRDFTVLIKNSIHFELFDIQRRNIENTLSDQVYLKTCRYHPTRDARCPIFRLKDIALYAGEDYDEMAKLGGVIAIKIDWDCNLDFDSVDSCFPKYSFERLDLRDALISPGFNYRYARYASFDQRTMYKVYGIKFVVMVSGRGGRMSVIPLLINVGSGVGLLAIATVICDIFMLYISNGKEIYKDKKYQFVTDIEHIDREEPVRCEAD